MTFNTHTGGDRAGGFYIQFLQTLKSRKKKTSESILGVAVVTVAITDVGWHGTQAQSDREAWSIRGKMEKNKNKKASEI